MVGYPSVRLQVFHGDCGRYETLIYLFLHVFFGREDRHGALLREFALRLYHESEMNVRETAHHAQNIGLVLMVALNFFAPLVEIYCGFPSGFVLLPTI